MEVDPVVGINNSLALVSVDYPDVVPAKHYICNPVTVTPDIGFTSARSFVWQIKDNRVELVTENVS